MASEQDISNMALMRLGVRSLVAQGDNTSSPNAVLAHTAFGLARDQLLASFPWAWAVKRAVLAIATVGDALGSFKNRPGWNFAYETPADMLVARYIWGGGLAPMNTVQSYPATWPPLPQLTPRVPIPAQKIPFAVEVSDGGAADTPTWILTDMNDTSQHPVPPWTVWSSGAVYTAGQIVNDDGTGVLNNAGPWYYCILGVGPVATHPSADPTHWLKMPTQPPCALLVYTAQITTTANFPTLFVDALAWRLAAELGLPLSIKGELVAQAWKMAEATRNNAAAQDANQAFDYEPDAEFIQFR